ncbi:hypothetical protein IFM89_033863 [Coptis chinensis]|uniref:Uncharacterized protein n=1 Tax=Coptis chinensis TaxID=261450 RepID=A0A835H2B9_9MAGN|nr:hypothetical protein IFM89_033863 [Coptis chinensis]
MLQFFKASMVMGIEQAIGFPVSKDFGVKTAYHYALLHPERVMGVITLGLPFVLPDQEIMDLVDPSTPLPSWFTEEDLANYATLTWLEGYGTTDMKVNLPTLHIQGEQDYVYKYPRMVEYMKGQVKVYVLDLEITFIPDRSHFVQEQFPEQVDELIILFMEKHIFNKNRVPPIVMVRSVRDSNWITVFSVGVCSNEAYGTCKLHEMRILIVYQKLHGSCIFQFQINIEFYILYPVTDPDVETDPKPFDRDRLAITYPFRDRNPRSLYTHFRSNCP